MFDYIVVVIRLVLETIILRQYSRNLLFVALVSESAQIKNFISIVNNAIHDDKENIENSDWDFILKIAEEQHLFPIR